MFVYAPDTRIREHPVKVASGEWTSVIGVMEGTFTKPMPIGNGKTIPPTGKPFKLVMCTVGHWKGGVMDEEYLFWDNMTYMKQIGVTQWRSQSGPFNADHRSLTLGHTQKGDSHRRWQICSQQSSSATAIR
jgi:hypothetical protein